MSFREKKHPRVVAVHTVLLKAIVLIQLLSKNNKAELQIILKPEPKKQFSQSPLGNMRR